ncbi:YXWGXW repeat-containing protein [Janthinobacterium fluminis]|uniref:YXWGXW repeat-containing protein n=1 Tax=Janthinobacterium fluminis TaxID=2987524 RepID=A0ABT5JV09_9BURK|nr:YXWGXW repeat-containing protein [Janthinobacterium fluminis]MDC8756549.1 YXWGXW repeat-containing protein [Janthinobacterium fluminis]
MKPSLYAAAMIAISSAAFLPAHAMAQVDVSIHVSNAPPPPKFESAPPARRGYVWAPGYWNWDGHRHVWSAGQWQPERDGSQYRAAEWVPEHNGWRLNRGGWMVVQSQPARGDYLQIAPPPPRHERMPRARHGYLWSPGYWEWRGQRYAWVPGAWLAERRGYDYRQPNWSQRDGHWYMEPGRWHRHGGRGDRDGDGVPNRHDRHPDNPRRD